jgi:hypothetical protein
LSRHFGQARDSPTPFFITVRSAIMFTGHSLMMKFILHGNHL